MEKKEADSKEVNVGHFGSGDMETLKLKSMVNKEQVNRSIS